MHSEARQCFESARELARSVSHVRGHSDNSAPSAAETKMEVGSGLGRAGWRETYTCVQVAIARGNEVFEELLAKAAAGMAQVLEFDDEQ